MARTAAQAGPRLIAFILPGIPASVPVARSRVRAALGFHGLGQYADDAAIITSELVTNAVQHAAGNDTETIEVTLARRDPSSGGRRRVGPLTRGPIKRDTPPGGEQGRGLQIVEALSAHWGWHQQDGGKTIFAVLAREA